MDHGHSVFYQLTSPIALIVFVSLSLSLCAVSHQVLVTRSVYSSSITQNVVSTPLLLFQTNKKHFPTMSFLRFLKQKSTSQGNHREEENNDEPTLAELLREGNTLGSGQSRPFSAQGTFQQEAAGGLPPEQFGGGMHGREAGGFVGWGGGAGGLNGGQGQWGGLGLGGDGLGGVGHTPFASARKAPAQAGGMGLSTPLGTAGDGTANKRTFNLSALTQECTKGRIRRFIVALIVFATGMWDLTRSSRVTFVQSPYPSILNKTMHIQRKFSDSIELNIERGLNIINVWSGQSVAAWIYDGCESLSRSQRMWKDEPLEKMLSRQEDAAKMQDGDTIWVSYTKLEEFSRDFLPYINTTFVLITTYDGKTRQPRGIELLAPSITVHVYLLGWFATNIGLYTGGYQFHPKVFPFPLGLKSRMGYKSFQNPIPAYRKLFLKLWNETRHNETKFQASKTTNIFAGQIGSTSDARKNIPSGKRLDYAEYIERIAKAKYVISPDGLKPDCHRHYESIGLGAIPITQLDPYLYSHLKEGPVIYQNDNWDLEQLNSSILPMDLNSPTRRMINRNLIFEEYWMEYVESKTGKPLRWWYLIQRKQAMLSEFELL